MIRPREYVVVGVFRRKPAGEVGVGVDVEFHPGFRNKRVRIDPSGNASVKHDSRRDIKIRHQRDGRIGLLFVAAAVVTSNRVFTNLPGPIE